MFVFLCFHDFDEVFDSWVVVCCFFVFCGFTKFLLLLSPNLFNCIDDRNRNEKEIEFPT